MRRFFTGSLPTQQQIEVLIKPITTATAAAAAD